MKPKIVGVACTRVAQLLDEALSEGALSLPPELAAHAHSCFRCSLELEKTEHVLKRLRSAAAGVDLARIPGVVDHVIAHTAGVHHEASLRVDSWPAHPERQRSHTRWVLGQLAVFAAVLLLLIGGATFTALKFTQAVGGTQPTELISHMTAPFRNWSEAQFGRGTR